MKRRNSEFFGKDCFLRQNVMSRRNSRAVVTTREESFYELVGPFSSLISGIWLRAMSVDVGRYQGLIAGHPSPRQLGRNDIRTANVSHSDQPHKSRRRACDVPLENTRLWTTWTAVFSLSLSLTLCEHSRVRPKNGLNPFYKCHPLCVSPLRIECLVTLDTYFSRILILFYRTLTPELLHRIFLICHFYQRILRINIYFNNNNNNNYNNDTIITH